MNNICLVRQTNDLKLLQETDMSNDGIYYNINHILLDTLRLFDASRM